MLKNIDPLLNSKLLGALRAMGHGDELVICDTNGPADSMARKTALGELLHVDGANSASVVRAILSVMPLDTFADGAALRMEDVGRPSEIPAVQAEVQQEIDNAEGRSWPLVSIERMSFYERAKSAYCVVQTGELRFYGCFIFKKGVLCSIVS